MDDVKPLNEARALRILLVDEDRSWTDSLSASLGQLGDCDVMAVSTATEALDLLKKGNSFQLVLSEVALSGSSGFELAHEIRKEHISKPEIVLVSSDPKVSVFDCHQVGACQILSKPINMPALVSVIKRLKKVEDNRISPRVEIDPATMGPLHGVVSYTSDPRNQSYKIDVSNIGRGGFFFKLDSKEEIPKLGLIMDFELRLVMVPNCVIKGRGIVRWNKVSPECTGVGVEFLQIPEDSTRLINAFVDLFKVRPFVPDES